MEIVREIRPIGPTCAALGYFDGVHRGHRAVLDASARQAASLGGRRAVLSLDMSAVRAKGKGEADILPEAERLALLEAAGAEVCLLPDFRLLRELSGEQFVDRILRDALGARAVCCGEDFRFGNNRAWGILELRELCCARDIRVLTVPALEDGGERISAKGIKQALARGDVPRAQAMLGREYGFRLPVYEEKHLARSLGFPTINQRFPDGIVRPRFGVYYSVAEVAGRRLPAVSNLGVRPTVEQEDRVTLETHILDFSGNLYGQSIPVFLKRFLRPEERFSGPQALRDAVEQNILEARLLAEKEG